MTSTLAELEALAAEATPGVARWDEYSCFVSDDGFSVITAGLNKNGSPFVYIGAEDEDFLTALWNDALPLLRELGEMNDEICQVLGTALGYPRFCDDQKNFPGATEESGVCVGDHVAESIAVEAAKEIARLREALRFYEDKRNYEEVPHGYTLASVIEMDKGCVARAALGIDKWLAKK